MLDNQIGEEGGGAPGGYFFLFIIVYIKEGVKPGPSLLMKDIYKW